VGTRWIVGLVPVALYAAYARTIGRPLMLFLILIMIPLAITERGVDSWIASLMTPAMQEIGLQGGWVLVYTSAIMMVLRFSAGPLVHRFNPVGLLAICSAIAAVGLLALSGAKGALLILGAATIYGIGKSFFWPTMLGVVSEQCPKGGALTLNALGGIGMLSVGIIGAPLIGMFQNKDQVALLEKQAPELVETVTEPAKWMGVEYTGVSPDKVAELKTRDEKAFAQVSEIEQASKQHALRKVAMFPAFMFVCYLILLLYFRSKGSYKPVEL
jgi:hypothetical protein